MVFFYGKTLRVTKRADTTRAAELPGGFLAVKAFSACCWFSLLGMMLSNKSSAPRSSPDRGSGQRSSSGFGSVSKAEQALHTEGRCPLCAQVCVSPTSLSVHLHDVLQPYSAEAVWGHAVTLGG